MAEDKDNWKWFLPLLHEDIGDYKQYDWNFMSDIQNVQFNIERFLPAMQEVMPGVKHKYCFMHLWRNFSKHWKCARSTIKAEFKINKWLRESWTKAYFSKNCKVDSITNNNCESFNAKILRFRNKPILSLCEDIRTYIMHKMTSAKLKMAARLGPLVPIQQSRLEKEKVESNKWTANWVGDPDGTRFEVCHHETRIDTKDYTDGILTIGSYNATYENYICPTRSQQYWETTPFDRPTPPHIKKRPDRLKKCRRKDQNKGQVNNSRLKRSYKEVTCTTCDLNGHNNRGCINGSVPLRQKSGNQLLKKIITQMQPQQHQMRLTALNLLHKLNNLQLILEITPTHNAENASTQNVSTPNHETIFIPLPTLTAFRPPPLRPPAPI
ncbi:hypothetical protein HKD37_12G033480 [Glycine soja]